MYSRALSGGSLTEPGPLREAGHKAYDKLRRSGDRGKKGGGEWGKTEDSADVESRQQKLRKDES